METKHIEEKCILALNSQKHKFKNVVQTGITQESSHNPEKTMENPLLSPLNSKRYLTLFKHASNNRGTSIVCCGIAPQFLSYVRLGQRLEATLCGIEVGRRE